MRNLLQLIIASILFMGCNSNTKEHPNFDELPTSKEIDYTLDLKSKTVKEASKILDLNNLTLLANIEKDTLSNNLFGIKTVKMDPEGNIYFTKKGSESIYVYNNHGKFEYTIGKKGKGPGEFQDLRTFDFNDTFEKLVVLDKFEIDFFKLNSGKYQYDHTIFPKVSMGKDICVLNNYLYYTGFKYEELDTLVNNDKPYNTKKLASGPIHKYDLSQQKTVDHFGPIYHSYSGWWMLDAQLSSMKLACNKKSNTIVGIFNNFGFLYGFESNGSLKWISKLDNYRYATLIEKNIGTENLRYSASPGAIFSPSRETNSKYVVFQLVNTLTDPVQIILDTENGEVFHGGAALPTMFDSKYGNRVVMTYLDAESEEKFSQLRIFKIN